MSYRVVLTVKSYQIEAKMYL